MRLKIAFKAYFLLKMTHKAKTTMSATIVPKAMPTAGSIPRYFDPTMPNNNDKPILRMTPTPTEMR